MTTSLHTLKLYAIIDGLAALFFVSGQAHALPERVFGDIFNTADVNSVAFAPNSRLLADARSYGVSSGTDTTEVLYPGPVRLWDAQTGRLWRELRHTGMVHSISFSPNGALLASAVENGFGRSREDPEPQVKGAVTVWNTATWQVAYTFNVPRAGVYRVAFAPLGHLLAVGCDDAGLRVWNTQTRKLKHVFWGWNLEATSTVAFSPDGRLLALVAGKYVSEQVVRLYDVESGRMLKTWPRQDEVAFSPDGKSLATSGFEKTPNDLAYRVNLWNVRTGRLQRALSILPDSAVTALAFAPNGQFLAANTTAQGGTLLLWNLREQQSATRLRGLTVRGQITFSPDSKLLAGCGFESSVVVWNLVSRSRSR